MRAAKRILMMAASVAALSSVASGYYHWIYFGTRNGPFVPIPVKFDLNALPDYHTVSYFISDQGPAPLMPGDTFQAIVSQIRLAGAMWNGVRSSDLPVKIGRTSSTATHASSAPLGVTFRSPTEPAPPPPNTRLRVSDVGHSA